MRSSHRHAVYIRRHPQNGSARTAGNSAALKVAAASILAPLLVAACGPSQAQRFAHLRFREPRASWAVSAWPSLFHKEASMPLTRDEIIKALGDVDDAVIAELIRMGA